MDDKNCNHADFKERKTQFEVYVLKNPRQSSGSIIKKAENQYP